MYLSKNKRLHLSGTLLCLALLCAELGRAGEQNLLHEAVQKNDLSLVKRALKDGVEIDSREENGNTALVLASIFGREEIAAYLIAHGADVEAPGVGGDTALLHAIDNNHQGVIDLLLRHGANIHALSGIVKKNALMLAIWQKNERTALTLIERGIDLKHRATGEGNSPLLLAACFDQLRVLQTLIDDKGMDKFERDNIYGKNILIEAAHCDAMTVLHYLIAQGFPVNSTDNSGKTAAFYIDRLATLKTLHKAGLDLGKTDNKGLNALSYAIAREQADIVQYLEANGVQEILVAPQGDTLLSAAVYGNDLARVKRYLQRGVDVNIRDADGVTAFMAAVVKGNTEIINLLLEQADVDVNGRYSTDDTPLEVVIGRGDEDMALRMIAKGAILETTNGYSSPLQEAVQAGLWRVVDEILRRNPKPMAKPEYFFTYAFSYNDIELVKKLHRYYRRHFKTNTWMGGGLYEAARVADANIVEFFIQQGAGLDYQEYAERKDHGVLRAAYEGDRRANFELLVKAGANLKEFKRHLPTHETIDAAYEQSYLGRVGIHAQYLVAKNARPKHTVEILNHLILSHQTAAIDSCLKRGVNVKQASDAGVPPLLAAVAVQNRTLARRLIDKGAPVNVAAPPSGVTPLILAAKRKDRALVKLLLAAGANAAAKDAAGRTAVDYWGDAGFPGLRVP